MIAGKNPGAFSERLHDFARTIENFAEIGEIAGGDVNIGGRGDEFFELARIAVNVAEDQDLHFSSFPCGGRMRDMRRTLRPSACQPFLRTLPASSKTTR